MHATAEWRRQIKEPMNLNIEQKLSNLNNRKNILKKKKVSASGTCGIVTKDVVFVSVESQKKRRENGLKISQKIMCETSHICQDA